MPHRRVPHPARAFPTRHCGGIRRALVVVAFHGRRVDDAQDVDVRREVLERIPLLEKRVGGSELLEAGELRVGDGVGRDLLRAVLDEFAAEEAHVRVGLLAVVHEAVRPLLRFVVGVVRVARRMRADEALAAANVVEQRLLARRGDGRLLVRARRAEIARGVEEDRVELVQVSWAELRAVLREGEIPALLVAEFEQHLLGVAGPAFLPGNHRVLEAARFGEEQDLFARRRGGVGRHRGCQEHDGKGARENEFVEHDGETTRSVGRAKGKIEGASVSTESNVAH